IKCRQKWASASGYLSRSISYTRRLGACAWSHARDRGVLIHSAGPALRNVFHIDNHVLPPFIEERHGHRAWHEGQFNLGICGLGMDGERACHEREGGRESVDDFVYHRCSSFGHSARNKCWDLVCVPWIWRDLIERNLTHHPSVAPIRENLRHSTPAQLLLQAE